MEGILGLGMLAGTFLSAKIFALIGYTGVFIICTSLSILALLITFCFLNETVEIRQDEVKKRNHINILQNYLRYFLGL